MRAHHVTLCELFLPVVQEVTCSVVTAADECFVRLYDRKSGSLSPDFS
jgi:hypothetical protein